MEIQLTPTLEERVIHIEKMLQWMLTKYVNMEPGTPFLIEEEIAELKQLVGPFEKVDHWKVRRERNKGKRI